ncbi:NHLP leader peptide family RiPP precursor [Desulfovibrio inopinatus]|uniref:NHLP leader peptide family RiPP precursor n=1 Tax=Desulfovibrio inopinatus TaxID=102109 RepID=UPI00040E82BA|nr:NHLP leader peptide family RiPP precursor [Desulfovibrio inopinatus]
MSNDIRSQVTNIIVEKAKNDATFKANLLVDATSTLKNSLNIVIPSNVDITVLEETPTNLYLVLPIDFDDVELSEQDEKNIAAGDSPTQLGAADDAF